MLDDLDVNAYPSGKGLIENLVRFCRFLRNHGLLIPFSSVLDAFHGLPLIDIADPTAFRCLLRANLVCRREDLEKFDELFRAFWLGAGRIDWQAPTAGTGSEENGRRGAAPSDAGEAGAWLPGGQVDGIDPDSERGAALRYSPQTRQAAVGPNELAFVESPSLSESVNRMLQPLANRLSRRSRYTIRGKEISLRRILRKNIQFGGELILLDFRRKKMKRRRVIFLCDVSGSMDIYTLLMLQFVHALRRVDPKTEVFFFSTNLTRVTPLFDAESFSTALFRLPQLVEDWGGGTRIGYCLERFNQVHARRFHPSKAIVMIFSDGWDRGEIDLLEEQMAHLKRRAYKIIWINPLLGTKDYQPICRGMRAALPYVDYFLPAGGARDLRLLGNTLEKMIA